MQFNISHPWNHIVMQGMDGLQLLVEIRQRFPDLPVMMVTAYGDDERRRRADELGASNSSPSRSISTG
jgi:CheY-like chemotaxis protein